MAENFIDYSRRNRTPSPTNQDPFSEKNAVATSEVQQAEPAANNPYNGGSQAARSQRSVGARSNRSAVRTVGAGGPAASGAAAGGRHVNVEHPDTGENPTQDHGYRAAHQGEADNAFFDPTFPGYQDEENLEMAWFPHNVVSNYGNLGMIGKARLQFRQALSFGLTLGAMGLVLVAAFASYLNPLKKSPPKAHVDKEYARRITGERLSGRPQYYAEYWGYRCDEHEIVTEGGWVLKAHRISDPRRGGAPGYPVILQHGILCNSMYFFTMEERSMAFWLVDQGYDVWVTNIRSNFDAGHTEYDRWDPRFWAWGLKELAFDLRDVVDFITGATGRPRVAYVGHSQGSGSMYLALSPGICPEIGNKISSFTALGPSVYAGPVLRKFPFSIMRQFRSRKWWSFIFGIREFIPVIGIFHQYLPAFWFGHIGYVIFAFLFGFHDHNWAARHKPKIFRALPIGTSSELLYWYMSGFSHRGCIFDPRITEPWFPKTFPKHSIYWGDIDYLVIGRPLSQRIERYERNVDIVHAVELAGYEHLDMVSCPGAVFSVFPGIKDTIEAGLNADERS